MTADRKHTAAYAYALVAVLFWSTSASAFKICLDEDRLAMPVPTVLLGASLTSTIALLVYLIITGKLTLLRDFTKTDYLYSAALGFLNPFLYYVVLFHAYSRLLAQEAQPLNFVWPITLVLLSIPLLEQKISPKSILAILVSFAGVFVIATRGRILTFRFTNPLGVALALSTTVVWSLFWIYSVKDKRDEPLRFFVNFLFGSLYVLLLAVVSGNLRIPSLHGLLGAAYIGLFEMGLTFLAWLRALKSAKTTAHVAGLIYLVPFGALVVTHLVLGETIFPSTIIGLILIISGIALQKLLA